MANGFRKKWVEITDSAKPMARIGAISMGGLVLAWIVSAQMPLEHPLVKQLEGVGGADFSTCASCHTDMSSGSVVHPALELGCEGCHGVDQVEGDESALIYPMAEGNQLCFNCHEDKKPRPSQLSVHTPVKTGPCTTCHDPHSSENASLLQMAPEGREAGENLCLTCHAEIASHVQRPVQHMAVDMGCLTCHVTHKSEAEDTWEANFHLVEAQPGLCGNCHDVEDTALQEAHFGQPFGSARCTRCHNPHGSDRAKLINAFAHMPFEEKMCEVCHNEPQEGIVSLIEDGRRDLCYTCHEDIRERIENAVVPHGLFEQRDYCTDCHSPHATAYPHQLRRRTVRVCEGCHTERREEQLTMKFLHPPVFDVGCTVCHDPHGGDNVHRLRASINELCLECHQGPNAPADENGMVTLFGNVKVPASSLEGIRKISISEETMQGHPLAGHPISGPNPLKPDEPAITCVTCHNPHASDFTRRRFQLKEGVKSVCLNCH